MKKSAGLFGGTFDPVHKGHVQIARAFVQADMIDELWVLLTPDPPHKSEKIHAPYVHRERMLEAAFSDIDGVHISTVENTLPRPTYTIQTLEFLTKNHPAYQYYLCIGEDSLVQFKKWYRYRDILDLCDLLVAHRPGFDSTNVDDDLKQQVHYIEHEPVDISSSHIRSLVREGKSVDEYLPREVNEIIDELELYRQT